MFYAQSTANIIMCHELLRLESKYDILDVTTNDLGLETALVLYRSVSLCFQPQSKLNGVDGFCKRLGVWYKGRD